jgi:hypothetical protein
LRGEVGLRSNPGEGVQVSPRSRLAEAAPHPNPLLVKNGERESSAYREVDPMRLRL